MWAGAEGPQSHRMAEPRPTRESGRRLDRHRSLRSHRLLAHGQGPFGGRLHLRSPHDARIPGPRPEGLPPCPGRVPDLADHRTVDAVRRGSLAPIMRLRSFTNGAIASLVLAASVALGPRPANARIYHDNQFGLTLQVPAGRSGCWPGPGFEDHSLDILLNPRAAGGCEDLEIHRHVNVFANDNFLHRTLERVFRDECAEGPRGHCLPSPGGLHIRNWPTRAGSTFQPGGWVNIRVVAQRLGASEGGERDADVYIFTLHTTRSQRNRDLVAFRRIIEGVRIEPARAQRPAEPIPTKEPPPVAPPSSTATPSAGPPSLPRAGA